MEPWPVFSFVPMDTQKLVEEGFLRPNVDPNRPEWIVPDDEWEPVCPPRYVVSFARFHECGFGMPVDKFIHWILHHYELKMQNLNPNSIQQVATFAALCKGYLGIEPNHILWKYYFFGSVFLKSSKKGGSSPVYIGSYALQLRYSRSDEYIPMKGVSSNKGWHHKWFYLINHDDAPLPDFMGRWYKDAPKKWMYGPPQPEMKRIQSLLQAMWCLVNAGMTGAGVIAAYHERRVFPLMRRERCLFDMVPGASLEGTVLVAAPLDRAEVKKHVKSTSGITITDVELGIHPLMRPDHNVVDLVRHFFVQFRNLLRFLSYASLCGI
jgi:hypothetical protein